MSLDRVEFQQDNAPSHSAKTTKEHLKNISLRVLQFPPNSPDLNPRDYFLWGAMEKHLMDLAPDGFGTVAELRAGVLWAWARLEKETVVQAIQSIVRRAQHCIDAGGGAFEFKL